MLGAVPGAPGCVDRVGAVAPSALALGSFVIAFVHLLVQVLGAVPGAPGCVDRVETSALSALALGSSVIVLFFGSRSTALLALRAEPRLVNRAQSIHLALGADPTYSRQVPVAVLCLVRPIVLH